MAGLSYRRMKLFTAVCDSGKKWSTHLGINLKGKQSLHFHPEWHMVPDTVSSTWYTSYPGTHEARSFSRGTGTWSIMFHRIAWANPSPGSGGWNERVTARDAGGRRRRHHNYTKTIPTKHNENPDEILHTTYNYGVRPTA